MGLALLVGEELGIEPDQVSFVYQDTEAGPYDVGSGGSQTTFNNGRALVAAAEQVRARLRELAASELETAAEDLDLADGAVHVRGAPNRAISIATIAQKAMEAGEVILGSGAPAPPPMPESFGSSCAGRIMFPAFQAPTFFCHAARVRVDRETGVVRVLDLAAVHDFGVVINPVGASGQVEGGAVHAVGMALTEGTCFADGRQLNPHLLDYKLPTAADVPAVKVAYVDRPAADGGPRGLKGVGEPPVVPTTGAIANAIAAATSTRVRLLPMTPERVWAALQERSNS
jgi:CO/xanthine dehydrogenase Mo-binding subunit